MGTLGAAAGLGAEECQQAPLEERAPLGALDGMEGRGVSRPRLVTQGGFGSH